MTNTSAPLGDTLDAKALEAAWSEYNADKGSGPDGRSTRQAFADAIRAYRAALTPAEGETARRPLTIAVVGGALQISIGLDVLANAVRFNAALATYDERTAQFFEPEITDPEVFSAAVVTALRSEEEDGTTLVHRMLDAAVIAAIEAGAEGIVMGDDKRLASRPTPTSGETDGGDLGALRKANIERQAIWCPDEVPDLSFRGNELGGEVGEALNVIKKLERERHGWRGSRDTTAHLAEELADVVICADLCAITAGIDLAEAVVAKFNATSDKVGISVRLASRPTPSGETE